MERRIQATGSALVASHAAQKVKLVYRTVIASQQTLVSSIEGFVPIKLGPFRIAQEHVMKVATPRFVFIFGETSG
jgi:hypothetical protein